MTSPTWDPKADSRELQWPSNLSREEFLEPLSKANVLVEMDSSRFMAEVRTRALWWIPQMGHEILRVNMALKLLTEYRIAARSRKYPKAAQFDINEAERRMEHRLGQLIIEGQEEGIFPSGKGSTAGKVTVHTFLGMKSRSQVVDIRDVGRLSQGDLEEAILRLRVAGDLGRNALLRIVRGQELKSDRSEFNARRRRTDSNRILTSFTEDLEAVTAGLEYIDPDDLDQATKVESKEAIWRAITKITEEMGRW